jgi:nucleoside-diphosphate-sugar epimerase
VTTINTEENAHRPIVIVGAGWLGLPLGHVLSTAGHMVRGTTTTAARLPELTAAGLEAHQISLEPDSSVTDWRSVLRDAGTLIISLPPGIRRATDPAAAEARYAAQLARMGALAADAGVERVVFLSSTAVYPDQPGAPILRESAADPAHPLVRAEQALAAALPPTSRLIIARLAGLIGSGRAPGRFFGAGRPVPQPEAPVNMLHLTDAIGAIRALLATPAAVGVFSVCAAQHPTRAAFYTAAAEALGLPAPPCATTTGDVMGKVVDSTHLRSTTGYVFQMDVSEVRSQR